MLQNAQIIPFPSRNCAAIWLMHRDGAWFVISGEHGWMHGDRAGAERDARWLANNRGLQIREVA